MNTAILRTNSLYRTAAIDLSLIVAACLVPALSHLTALPIYQLNPMMLCLLASLALVKDRRNAILMAVLIPVASMLAVGMPTPMKALCMVPEMLTMVAVHSLATRAFKSFSSSFLGQAAVIFSAILAGKIVFYGLKALVIAPAMLISTPVLTQVLVMAGSALAFAAFCKR